MAKLQDATITVGDSEISLPLYFEVVELHEQEHHADNIVYKLMRKQHIPDIMSFRQTVSQIIYNQEVMQGGTTQSASNPVRKHSLKRVMGDKGRLSRIPNLNELDDMQSTERIAEEQDSHNGETF